MQEPTSGLDSSSALSLLETLVSVAREDNKTVITSIHQPSSQLFHMFDGILLMAKGKVLHHIIVLENLFVVLWGIAPFIRNHYRLKLLLWFCGLLHHSFTIQNLKLQVAYFGAASEAMDYVASVGLRCTMHYNPADYLREYIPSH